MWLRNQVSVAPSVHRGALKLGCRTDALGSVGSAAASASVCHLGLMGTSMNALATGT